MDHSELPATRGDLEVILAATGDIVREVRLDLEKQIGHNKSHTTALSRAVDGLKSRQPNRQPPRADDIIIRHLTARFVAHTRKFGVLDTARHLYGENFAKAITDPGMATVAGWAVELANIGTYGGLLPVLSPQSAYAQLARRGLRVSLGGSVAMRLPYRAWTAPASVPSPFVGESQPAPVREFRLSQGALLEPKKAAILSFYTGELARRSTPSIEAVLRQCLAEDCALAIDSILLSAAGEITSPPTPAGLLAGVAGLTPSASTDPAKAAAEDIASLVAAIVPAASDQVFVMNSGQAMMARLLLPTGFNLPIIESDTLQKGKIVCLDASDFASSADDGAEITIGDDAVIHTEDISPLPIATGTSGASAATAAPVMSIWQVDVLAIRLMEFIDWKMRRQGRVSWLTGAKW